MNRLVKLSACVLAVILMISCLTAAETSVFAEQSGLFLYRVEDNQAILTGVSSSALGDIEVPEELGGYPVTMVQGAFKSNSRITSVALPGTVKVITEDSFYYCINLRSIDLPDGLARIDMGAFSACVSLESVDIPDSVTTLGQYSFSWCSRLNSVHISTGIGYIDSGVFTGCTNLDIIEIPDNISYIANGAFSDTKFYNNINNWEDDVLYLGNHILAAKTTVGGTYEVKAGTKSISNLSFVNCSYLRELIIPESLKRVGGDAFSGCNNLTDVYYTGDLDRRRTIDVGKNNNAFKNALWHYGYDPNVKEYHPGDINGDDEIDNRDLVRIFQYVSGWDVEVMESVIDVNGDKTVNNKDVIRLFRYLCGWDVKIYSISTNYSPIGGEDTGPIVSF